MEKLDTERVLFEALQYPLFAIPEFFIKKQIESGWSKSTYLTYLLSQCDSYTIDWTILKNKAIFNNPKIDLEEIGMPLTELTNGLINEARTLGHKTTSILNRELIDTLYFLIKKAEKIGQPLPVYSNLQIVSFVEKALNFIHYEFEVQCGIVKGMYAPRTYPKNFRNVTEEGEITYLLHSYSIIQPTPVFDLFIFQEALRELELNSRQNNNLKLITKPLYERSNQIVNLWNEKLYDLEESSDKEKIFRNRRFIRFDTDERKFLSQLEIKKFVLEKNKSYSNNDLAMYAAQIGNLISSEILEKENDLPEVITERPSYLSIALLHHYWYKNSKEVDKEINNKSYKR